MSLVAAGASYALGLKALVRLCSEQKVVRWHDAKLHQDMFRGDEVEVFNWVSEHVKSFHVLPQLETLAGKFPDVQEISASEPSKYYVDLLDKRYAYETINKANVESQSVLKEDKNSVDKAEEILRGALSALSLHRYRAKIVDVGVEGPKMVLQTYHKIGAPESVCSLGWPYMDDQSGGAYPGDVVCTVGRPATGKTYLTLYGALANWKAGKTVLVVSMEMVPLPLVQRVAAMYAHTNITQLKISGYSTETYNKFISSLFQMPSEKGKFYIVDGNLAASVEDIYLLASQLQVNAVYIDGAYLMKHPNRKLDRYTRVAENIELQKKFTTELGIPTFPSYQLSREATKKKDKKQKADLEDIGYSDAIGQIGTIIVGLFQEEGIETMNKRTVTVMKGRNGEVGSFNIWWRFDTMMFDQVGAETNLTPEEKDAIYQSDELAYL